MKTIKIITFLLSVLIFTIGYSASSYEILKENPSSPKFKEFKSIYVGWLDLKENDYDIYGQKQNDWKTLIRVLNTEGLQVYLKEAMPGTKITGAASSADRYPGNADLRLQFKLNDRIKYKIGFKADCDLIVDVMIFDGMTNNLLYTTTVVTHCMAGFSHLNWKANSFDGALDNEVRYLATAIADKLKNK